MLIKDRIINCCAEHCQHCYPTTIAGDRLPTRLTQSKIEANIHCASAIAIPQTPDAFTVNAYCRCTCCIPVSCEWCPTRRSGTKAESSLQTTPIKCIGEVKIAVSIQAD